MSTEMGPLHGVRILDLSHQYSGAFASSMLGDLGADVLAVEHPSGSPIRTMLPKKDGESLWWKTIQRNKRLITLNLSETEGQDLLRRIVTDFDVLVENFRPGTLEKWGLGPENLEAVNPDLIMVRISGYGQSGPYSRRPGYGTVAEALSGFAHLNGFPESAPALPSITLADGVAALFAVIGALTGLSSSRKTSLGREGFEVVDVSLLESLIRIIPNQLTALQQLNVVLERQGNCLIDKGVLRDLYRSQDGRYFTIGGGIGERSMGKTLSGVDAPDNLRDELNAGILKKEDSVVKVFLASCNQHIHDWSSQRLYAEIDETLQAADVVFGPIYNAQDLMNDPHVRARGIAIKVDDDDWGEVVMPAPVPRFSSGKATLSHAGLKKGSHNRSVFIDGLGLTEDDLLALEASGVV